VLSRFVEEPDLLRRLRETIPSVRTIEDDVASARELYRANLVPANTGPRRIELPATEPLAAIVLNYQTPDETLLTVKSLLASQRPIERVIVVNNDANESPCANVTKLSPRVRYVHTGRNLGFSGGVNVGIQAALETGAARILLVNSDVIVPPDCIGRLEQALES